MVLVANNQFNQFTYNSIKKSSQYNTNHTLRMFLWMCLFFCCVHFSFPFLYRLFFRIYGSRGGCFSCIVGITIFDFSDCGYHLSSCLEPRRNRQATHNKHITVSMEHRPIAIPIVALETNIVPSNVWKKS
jgi:hypothetical protein